MEKRKEKKKKSFVIGTSNNGVRVLEFTGDSDEERSPVTEFR
jgi:hypothetical protein